MFKAFEEEVKKAEEDSDYSDFSYISGTSGFSRRSRSSKAGLVPKLAKSMKNKINPQENLMKRKKTILKNPTETLNAQRRGSARDSAIGLKINVDSLDKKNNMNQSVKLKFEGGENDKLEN